jgi:hypothetical protein
MDTLTTATPWTTTPQGAIFSDCRTWRYLLWRTWGAGPLLLVIGLNPSTADETQDDPTIRRCIGFARDCGYKGLLMTNLFALRATHPIELRTHADPVGPANNDWLIQSAAQVHAEAGMVLCAWGVHSTWQQRGASMRSTLTAMQIPLWHLGLTQGQHPRHPLYLPHTIHPFRWQEDTPS